MSAKIFIFINEDVPGILKSCFGVELLMCVSLTEIKK